MDRISTKESTPLHQQSHFIHILKRVNLPYFNKRETIQKYNIFFVLSLLTWFWEADWSGCRHSLDDAWPPPGAPPPPAAWWAPCSAPPATPWCPWPCPPAAPSPPAGRTRSCCSCAKDDHAHPRKKTRREERMSSLIYLSSIISIVSPNSSSLTRVTVSVNPGSRYIFSNFTVYT